MLKATKWNGDAWRNFLQDKYVKYYQRVRLWSTSSTISHNSFLWHQLLSNLSHPQFHRDQVVCRTLRNPNPDVIPGWRPFPPEQTTDNPWHLQFITAALVQQAVLKQHPDSTPFSTESQRYESQWFKPFKAQRLLDTAPALTITVGCIYVFVWISEQTAIISLYNIKRLFFITETECVYCAVRIWVFIYNTG